VLIPTTLHRLVVRHRHAACLPTTPPLPLRRTLKVPACPRWASYHHRYLPDLPVPCRLGIHALVPVVGWTTLRQFSYSNRAADAHYLRVLIGCWRWWAAHALPACCGSGGDWLGGPDFVCCGGVAWLLLYRSRALQPPVPSHYTTRLPSSQMTIRGYVPETERTDVRDRRVKTVAFPYRCADNGF